MNFEKKIERSASNIDDDSIQSNVIAGADTMSLQDLSRLEIVQDGDGKETYFGSVKM